MKKLMLFALCTLASAQVTNYARMLSGVNYQSGTTYIFQAIDTTRVTQFANAAPVAATLPNGATVGFQAGTLITVRNKGAGTATITCSGCTINGAATLALTTGQAVDLYSDGLNYVADQGGGGSSGGLPANVYQVTANGLVCNGTYSGGGTDDTAALNALLTTVNAAGGGTIVFPAGQICLFNSAEITLPNNGDTWSDPPGTISTMAPIRLTCGINGPVQFQEIMSTGATISQIQNACVINDTFNATDAKFVGLAMGHLEVDHLAFIDTGSDGAAFWLFTNTMPDFHDNAFIGSTISQTGGPYSINDVFIFGGATATQPCKTVNCWFQGYAGQRIYHNFYNAIRRVAVLYAAANTLTFRDDTIWSQSGCSTCGAYEIQAVGAGAYGNSFVNLHIEAVHYLYGVNIAGTAGVNINNYADQLVCSDGSEFATQCFKNGGDPGAVLIGQDNAGAGGFLLGPADVITGAIVTGASSTGWKNSIHWNGFIELLEQAATNTPPALTTEDMMTYSSGVPYAQRPLHTKWHQNPVTHAFADLDEVPTTQVSSATDNFTRANSGSLGANWTAISSLTGLAIASNTAQTQTATGAYEGNYYTNVTFPNDQFSQCTLGAVVSNTNNFVGCAVRVQSGAESFYAILLTTDGQTFCAIRKFAAGVVSNLQACSGAGFGATVAPPTSGDVLTITAIGNNLAAYRNGIPLATTSDSAFPTGSPGLVAFPSSVATAISYSGWAGGPMDCTTGAVTSMGPLQSAICGGPLANASTVQKSESGADTNVLTFATSTVPATYRINFALSISAATAGVVGWTATWTDSNGNAQTPTNLAWFQVGTPAPQLTFTTSAAGDYYGTALVDTNNSGTNIVIKFTLGSGSVTAKASASVERVQ